MKKHLLLLCFAFLASSFLYGQQYWSKRYDIELGNEYGSQVIARADGFVVFMWGFCGFNNAQFCYGIIKFDLNGEKKWQALMYDTIGPNSYIAMAIRNDTIFVNTDYKTIEGYSVLSYDLQGNYLGRFDYTHPGVYGTLWARNIKSKEDRLFVSFSYQDTTDNRFKAKTRAYDQAWNQLWEVVIPDNDYPKIRFMDMDACADGGVIIACVSSKSYDEVVCSVQKYDAQGNKEWSTLIHEESDIFSVPVSINAHPDGGYMGHWTLSTGAGFTNPEPDCWFKLDANGLIEWQKVVDPYEYRNFTTNFIARNGDMIGCGYGEDTPYDTIDEPDRFYGYIARIKPTGELRWERRFFERKEGGYYPLLYHGAELENGDLAFTGLVWDTIQTPQNPSWDDLWLLKLDSNGCLTPGCDYKQYVLPAFEPEQVVKLDAFSVFPNPCTEHFTLAAILGKHLPLGTYHMALYDAFGREVLKQDFNPNFLTKVEIGDMTPGGYTLVIFLNGKEAQTLKVLKV